MPKLPNPMRLSFLVAGTVAYASACILILTYPESQPLYYLANGLAWTFLAAVFAAACLHKGTK